MNDARVTPDGWIRTGHLLWRRDPDINADGWEVDHGSGWMGASEEEHLLLDAIARLLQQNRLLQAESAQTSRAAIGLLDKWRAERNHADALADALRIVQRDFMPDDVKVPMLAAHWVRRLPCDFCGEPCGDHTEAETQSCVADIEARQL